MIQIVLNIKEKKVFIAIFNYFFKQFMTNIHNISLDKESQ